MKIDSVWRLFWVSPHRPNVNLCPKAHIKHDKNKYQVSQFKPFSSLLRCDRTNYGALNFNILLQPKHVQKIPSTQKLESAMGFPKFLIWQHVFR